MGVNGQDNERVQLIRNFIEAGKAQDPAMILKTIESWLAGLI